MNWSFRLARVAGIDIKVHVTFFIILVIGALQWSDPYGLRGAAFGVLLMILLFTCVVLHELGHSLVAQRFGIPVREIILLPLGGVAVLSRMPTRPLHELLIAIAGPLVNVIIAALLLLVPGTGAFIGGLDGREFVLGDLSPSLMTAVFWLFASNVTLVLFNLIPAFPLDGGRMLRAVIAMVIGWRRATRISSAIGQIIAILLGAFGLITGNILLALVAIFVFFGAGQEEVQGQARAVLTTLRVGDAYNKHALTLSTADRVSKVVDYILTSYQRDFAVMQGDRPLGIVTREDVLAALANDPRDLYVNGIMHRDFARVAANTSLDEVREIMAERGARVVAVFEGERYLGLVSIEDIAEAFTVLTFVRRQQEARRAEQVSAG